MESNLGVRFFSKFAAFFGDLHQKDFGVYIGVHLCKLPCQTPPAPTMLPTLVF